MPIDADLLAVQEGMARDGLTPLYQPGPPEESRQRGRDARARRYPPLLLEVGSVENREIPGPAGPLRVRIYEAASPHPRPIIVFFHGGGWMIGDIDSHDGHARRLANRVSATVVSVEYRLAPEHPFPAGYEDCLAATIWALEHEIELGGDGSVCVAGDSSGGNLAAAVSLELRNRGSALSAQLLLYPVVDLGALVPAVGMSVDEGALFVPSQYLAGRFDLTADPRVSPSRANDLSSFPPTVIGVAEFDNLRDQGVRYARALEAAGVSVVLRDFDGMIHGFFGMGGVSPAANRACDVLCSDLKSMLSAAHAPRNS